VRACRARPPVSDTTFHDTNDRRIKSMHIGFPPGLCGTHSFHIDIDAADARGQSVARMSIPVFVEVVGPLLIRPAHPVIQYSSQSHPEKLVTLPRLDALTTTEGVEVINARSADSRLIITRLSERDAHGNAAFSVQAPAGQYIKAAIEFCYSINGIALPSMVDATPIEFVPVNAHASRLPAEEY